MKQVGAFPFQSRERCLLAEVEPRVLVKRPDIPQLVFHIPVGPTRMAERNDVADGRRRRHLQPEHIRRGEIIDQQALRKVACLRAAPAERMERNQRHIVGKNHIKPGHARKIAFDGAHEDRAEHTGECPGPPAVGGLPGLERIQKFRGKRGSPSPFRRCHFQACPA